MTPARPPATALARNAVTLSFCQTARSSRTTMPILVSNRMFVRLPRSPRRGLERSCGGRRSQWTGAPGLVPLLALGGPAAGGHARPLRAACLPPAQSRVLLLRRHGERRPVVHLPWCGAHQRDRHGHGVQPRRPARRPRRRRARLHLPHGAHRPRIWWPTCWPTVPAAGRAAAVRRPRDRRPARSRRASAPCTRALLGGAPALRRDELLTATVAAVCRARDRAVAVGAPRDAARVADVARRLIDDAPSRTSPPTTWPPRRAVPAMRSTARSARRTGWRRATTSVSCGCAPHGG